MSRDRRVRISLFSTADLPISVEGTASSFVRSQNLVRETLSKRIETPPVEAEWRFSGIQKLSGLTLEDANCAVSVSYDNVPLVLGDGDALSTHVVAGIEIPLLRRCLVFP